MSKKIIILFSLKNWNPHPPCKIYDGIDGETKRYVELRYPQKNKHLKCNHQKKYEKMDFRKKFFILASIDIIRYP